MKTIQIRLDVKDPDELGRLSWQLEASEETCKEFLRWSEYATIELEVDQMLNIVSARFVPVSE